MEKVASLEEQLKASIQTEANLRSSNSTLVADRKRLQTENAAAKEKVADLEAWVRSKPPL